MNAEQWLKEMAGRAQAEPPPPVDVRDGVAARLALAADRGGSGLVVLAALSGVAAAVVLAVAINAWSAWTDPITEMFVSTVMVLQ